MPFVLMKGEFVPEAGRPDGDSIRFRPDNVDLIFKLRQRGRPPRINPNNGTIQLRFEGIDTMESKAAEPFSLNATKSNLELCDVPDGTGTARGFILTNQLGPNGRPIVFVYSGESSEPDGEEIFLEVSRMKESVNFIQLSRGHAYPLFYDTLFDDLRKAMAAETTLVRTKGENIWSADVTQNGAIYSGASSLSTMAPIFPKLWRRLESYSQNSDIANPESLSEFLLYLSSLREERVLIPSQSRVTGFDDVIAIDDNQINLTVTPEDLIIVSV